MKVTNQININNNEDPFIIAGKEYKSRLLVGTGKYDNIKIAKDSIAASGANIVTFALQRLNLENENHNIITDHLPREKYTYLPNSAGCYNAQDAVRALNIAREISNSNLVKLEVIGDKNTLYPNIIETIKAAKILVKDNFSVMVYCTDDPIIARTLEDIGCSAIMPLASPIGSGLGIQNILNIKIIVQNAKIPVLIDAGIGTASDAAIAMEIGCDGVLLNSAIAKSKNPILMAKAMSYAVKAGRYAYLAKRMGKSNYAIASSPNSKLNIG